jgi:AcrR family transcriptional regulator
VSVEPTSRRERHRLRNSERVLAAAERAFQEHGVHGATLEDIAEQADVSVGTIYNHFGGKPGLYLASVERAVELNRRYMDLAYQPELRPIEQILTAADAYLLFHLEHPGYFQMVAMPQAAGGDAAAAERIAAIVDTEVSRFADCVQRAIDAGEIVGDAEQIATFMWGAWNGVIALAHRPDRLRRDDEEIRRVLAAGRRIVLEGLGARSVRDSDGALAADLRRPRASDYRGESW